MSKERLSDYLHRYADALTDSRKLENVYEVEVMPKANQDLLLAKKGLLKFWGYKENFPTNIEITDLLRQFIIEVTAKDNSGVKLGVFFTHPYAASRESYLRRYKALYMCVYPTTPADVRYHLRPDCFDSVRANDDRTGCVYLVPFANPMPIGAPYVYRKSRIIQIPPRKIDIREQGILLYGSNPFLYPEKFKPHYTNSLNSDTYEGALESNVIPYLLSKFEDNQMPPYLKESGIRSFLNTHCSDPRYVALHCAMTQYIDKDKAIQISINKEAKRRKTSGGNILIN